MFLSLILVSYGYLLGLLSLAGFRQHHGGVAHVAARMHSDPRGFSSAPSSPVAPRKADVRVLALFYLIVPGSWIRGFRYRPFMRFFVMFQYSYSLSLKFMHNRNRCRIRHNIMKRDFKNRALTYKRSSRTRSNRCVFLLSPICKLRTPTLLSFRRVMR